MTTLVLIATSWRIFIHTCQASRVLKSSDDTWGQNSSSKGKSSETQSPRMDLNKVVHGCGCFGETVALGRFKFQEWLISSETKCGNDIWWLIKKVASFPNSLTPNTVSGKNRSFFYMKMIENDTGDPALSCQKAIAWNLPRDVQYCNSSAGNLHIESCLRGSKYHASTCQAARENIDGSKKALTSQKKSKIGLEDHWYGHFMGLKGPIWRQHYDKTILSASIRMRKHTEWSQTQPETRQEFLQLESLQTIFQCIW